MCLYTYTDIWFGSVQLCPTLWPHGLQHARCQSPSSTPELTQAHVHWVGDTTQPSHPLSFPSPPAFNLSQHQGLFQWVSSFHQVVKVLEFQLQHQSFQWIFRIDFIQDGLIVSPCSPRDSQESSPTPHNSKASVLWYSEKRTTFFCTFLYPNHIKPFFL